MPVIIYYYRCFVLSFISFALNYFSMKYYIVAGEPSGDLHGALLVEQIKKVDKQAEFRGWGGDKMIAQGVTVTKHVRELAFMGFVEVVKNLGTIKKNFDFIKKDIVDYNPDAVILVDYPGFNLRLAKFLKNKGFTVIYYIAPQVWAWKQSRVKTIKKYVDKLFVILPFEKEFFAKFGISVVYEGHPLKEHISKFLANYTEADRKAFLDSLELGTDDKIVALLPGSRVQEVEKKLPVMAAAAAFYRKDYKFVVAGSSNVPDDVYKTVLGRYGFISVVKDKTFDLLANSYAAVVTSGTATLETALFGVPEIICYKAGSKISYHIAKRVIKVKYISLVNLINDELTVRELIQDDCNEQVLSAEMNLLLNHAVYRQKIEEGYKKLHEQLGSGEIVRRIATQMVVIAKRK